jgi:HAMP domain-containing protein
MGMVLTTRARWRWRWSLRVRLLAVVLLGLLPIAVLLGFLWQGARDRDRDDTLSNLTQTAEAVGVIADDLFDEGITLGQAIATDPAILSLDPARFAPRLREIHARVPQYTNIMVVDGAGTILGWTAPDPLPAPPPSVAERRFFARVVDTGRPTTIRVTGEIGPHPIETGVAVPITAADGSLLGLLAITLDPAHVSRRLDQVRPFSGQVFSLIDPNGQIAMYIGPVSQQAATLTWEQRDRSGRPEVQAALAGKTSSTAAFRGAWTGQDRLAAFTPTARHGWVIGSTWTITQALGPTRQAEQRELAVFVAIVLVILVGALALSRAMVAPIRRLAEHARELGDGHFVRINDTLSDDEIGDLTVAFNAMGERLQGTLNDLRQERARLETVLHHLPVGVVIRSDGSGACRSRRDTRLIRPPVAAASTETADRTPKMNGRSCARWPPARRSEMRRSPSNARTGPRAFS